MRTWRDWTQAYPFVGLFVCTACLVLLAYYTSFPINLRADTEADYPDSTAIFRVQVYEPPVSRPYGTQVAVHLLQLYQADTLRPLHQDAMLVLYADTAYTSDTSGVPAPRSAQMGDVLLVQTAIRRPAALFAGDFDYGSYLRLQHKVGVGYVGHAAWQIVGHERTRTLRGYAQVARQHLAQRYERAGLHGRSLALAKAVTLGEKDELDSDLRQSFAAAGAAHVLAVSGLHTGLIYWALISLLTGFGLWRPLYHQRVRRWLLALTVILILWVYAFLTGLTPSVVRAVLMITIVQMGWALRRQSFSLNTLAAAACLCVWHDPLVLFQVSFQLSFAAVLGILAFVPYLNGLLHVPHTRILQFIRDCVTVSLAATAGTLPFTLYYFAQLPNYFLLTNILILPAAFLIVLLGVFTLVFARTFIGVGLGWLLQYLNEGVCRYVEWIDHLPLATMSMPTTLWMAFFVAVAVTLLYVGVRTRHLYWLVGTVAAVAVCCVMGVKHSREALAHPQLAARGRTLYYRHGGTTDTCSVATCMFFTWQDTAYVYAPHLSPYRRERLEQFCERENILKWEQR